MQRRIDVKNSDTDKRIEELGNRFDALRSDLEAFMVGLVQRDSDVAFGYKMRTNQLISELKNRIVNFRDRTDALSKIVTFLRGGGKLPRQWKRMSLDEIVGLAATIDDCDDVKRPVTILTDEEARHIVETEAKCVNKQTGKVEHYLIDWGNVLSGIAKKARKQIGQDAAGKEKETVT
jgi:hypothetical protein